MLSGLGYATLRAAGLTAVSRHLQGGGLTLCYHNVMREHHTPVPGDPGLHLALERFEGQMEWLKRHYTVIPLLELVTRLRGGHTLRGTVAITFDDGYDGVLTHAVPVLRTLGLPATLFIVGAAPDAPHPYWWDQAAVRRVSTPARHLGWLLAQRGDGDTILASLGGTAEPSTEGTPRSATWSAIRAGFGAGIDVGAHSLGHRTLTTLTDTELDAELHEGRAIIERKLGVLPALFAYPYGRWDPRVRDAVRRAGYAGAVTLDTGFVEPNDDRWSLKRLNIPSGLGLSAYACWLAGLHRAEVA